MRASLPRRLLPKADHAEALLVAAEGTLKTPEIRITLRRRRREILLGHFCLDEAGRCAARAAVRVPSRRVILRPSPSAVLERRVVLPLAAEHDVMRLLYYDMDRLTPFRADQVFWQATVEHRDRTAGRLELCLSLIPRTVLQPVLSAVQEIGLKVSAIETTSRSHRSRYIDLTQPPSFHRRVFYVGCGAIAVLALATVAIPYAMQSVARERVEVRIAALRPRILQIDALRRRIAAGTAGNDVIAAEQARVGDALQVLARITDLLPDDAVLADFTLRQGKLSISGRSRAVPSLIAAMVGDTMLHNPSFAAPILRTLDGKADTFVIHAELNP